MSDDQFLENDAFMTAEFLKLALDASGIGVWKFDPQTQKIEWSEALKRIMGVGIAHTVDDAFFYEMVHPDDRERVREAYARVLDSASDGNCDEQYRIITPAGVVKSVAVRGRTYFEGGGAARKPVLFLGTLRDDTDRKSTEAALHAAIERGHILLHEVNHRVKNSLQLVSSLLRLQARRISDPAVRQQLSDATARISTIAHIHRRLYHDHDVRQINFGTFLSELCTDLQNTAPECSLTVCSPDFAIATDRAIPLALIVNELVTNACKYAYPDGRGPVQVTVGLQTVNEVRISVADRGVGLPEGFSLDNATSLGMTLIGGLLDQLGGRLEVAGQPGATFTVKVPLQEATRSPASPEAAIRPTAIRSHGKDTAG